MLPKRTHPDARRFFNAARHGQDIMEATQGQSLIGLDIDEDRAALARVAHAWNQDPALHGELRSGDLLAIALAQDLPCAFHTWFALGQPVNGDTFLAFLHCGSDHFLFLSPVSSARGAASLGLLAPFVATRFAPWHAVVFFHLLTLGRSAQPLALAMLTSGRIDPATLLPATHEAAEGWLWWDNPQERNAPESLLPLHAALLHGNWDLAQALLDQGASPTAPAPNGQRPLEIVAQAVERERLLGRHWAAQSQSHGWLARLQSANAAAVLDAATCEGSRQDVPRRL